uniref:ATP synthase subunit a n=1 Tax=Lottia digitalis TaxID=225159 RepID=Q2I6Z7_9GAST|nr:ATP synthase F0 subunit 6 [Lottia digitalis]ABC00938.1 ATP synthase F0 subunit 6 [Lottia digitalis]
MLVDLFSIFDYQVYVSNKVDTKYIIAFWALSLSAPSLIYSSGAWTCGSVLWSFVGRPVTHWAWTETRLSVKDSGSSLLVMSACLWVAMVVLWQGVPGVFVSVAHLSVTGCVALPYWSGMVLASSLTCSSEFLASFVPSGCPYYLAPVLVIVEFFSHLMRPLALCARLSLTTMTGHIILGLVWGLSSEVLFSLENFYPYKWEWDKDEVWVSCVWFLYYSSEAAVLSFVIITINIFLILVEVGISCLQAYIFFTLLLFFSTQYPRFNGPCLKKVEKEGKSSILGE